MPPKLARKPCLVTAVFLPFGTAARVPLERLKLDQILRLNFGHTSRFFRPNQWRAGRPQNHICCGGWDRFSDLNFRSEKARFWRYLENLKSDPIPDMVRKSPKMAVLTDLVRFGVLDEICNFEVDLRSCQNPYLDHHSRS